MTSRIDHAAEADAFLSANAALRPDLAALFNATVAQAHATLEVAKQQRIANLIALSQTTTPTGDRLTAWQTARDLLKEQTQ